jgi:hypothetical protein
MCEVRFAPINGHRKRDAACPKSANSGHPQSHIVRATLGRITEQVKVE